MMASGQSPLKALLLRMLDFQGSVDFCVSPSYLKELYKLNNKMSTLFLVFVIIL
jgi:hypothetical protein